MAADLDAILEKHLRLVRLVSDSASVLKQHALTALMAKTIWKRTAQGLVADTMQMPKAELLAAIQPTVKGLELDTHELEVSSVFARLLTTAETVALAACRWAPGNLTKIRRGMPSEWSRGSAMTVAVAVYFSVRASTLAPLPRTTCVQSPYRKRRSMRLTEPL